MSSILRNFYGTAFAPDGSKLHDANDAWKENQYWNDACWHRCVPENATGLTFMDVGAAEGNYVLRFEQRGGKGIGLNFHADGRIITSGENYARLGLESDAPRYLQLKELWKGDFKVIIGGFGAGGEIVPEMPKVNISCCLNVLEYILRPREAVAAIFRNTSDRVLIATDVIHEGNTGPPGIEPIIQQCFRLGELISWCPWPTVFWQHSVPCDGREWPQAFICATNPDSKLPAVDPSEVSYDRAMHITETQRFWQSKA